MRKIARAWRFLLALIRGPRYYMVAFDSGLPAVHDITRFNGCEYSGVFISYEDAEEYLEYRELDWMDPGFSYHLRTLRPDHPSVIEYMEYNHVLP